MCYLIFWCTDKLYPLNLFWGFSLSVMVTISRKVLYFFIPKNFDDNQNMKSDTCELRYTTECNPFWVYNDVPILDIYIHEQRICQLLHLQFVIFEAVILSSCKSWCIEKVLTIDCSILLILSYSCCSFFPILKIITQKTNSSSFNCAVTKNHWHIFIFMWVEAVVSTKKNTCFSLSHCLYIWKKSLHCWLHKTFV